ncbi:MAG: hypothetical protein Q4P33_09225 [Flaviflexus sp.]|nr:hypothetical protein [Flaviflexus sp.]
MPRRSGLSTPAFLLSTAIGVALFTLIVMVMGARLDSGPKDPEPASQAEQARQQAALDLDVLTRGAAQLGEEDLEEIASSELAEIGGVWVPWPDEVPEGKSNPPIHPLPENLDVAGLTELFDGAIDSSREALTSAPDTEVARYASQFMVLLAERRAWGAEVEADPLPAPLTADELAALVSDSETFLRLSTAEQWLEVAAARASDEQREALAKQAQQLSVLTFAMSEAAASANPPIYAPLPDWFWESAEDPAAPLRLRTESAKLITSHAIFLAGQVAPEYRADVLRSLLALTSRADTEEIIATAVAAPEPVADETPADEE